MINSVSLLSVRYPNFCCQSYHGYILNIKNLTFILFLSFQKMHSMHISFFLSIISYFLTIHIMGTILMGYIRMISYRVVFVSTYSGHNHIIFPTVEFIFIMFFNLQYVFNNFLLLFFLTIGRFFVEFLVFILSFTISYQFILVFNFLSHNIP